MQVLPLVWMPLVAWTVQGQAEKKKMVVLWVAHQADLLVGHQVVGQVARLVAHQTGDRASHPLASQQEEFGVAQRVDLLEVHPLVHGQHLSASWVPLLAEEHVPWRDQQSNPQGYHQAHWVLCL